MVESTRQRLRERGDEVYRPLTLSRLLMSCNVYTSSHVHNNTTYMPEWVLMGGCETALGLNRQSHSTAQQTLPAMRSDSTGW